MGKYANLIFCIVGICNIGDNQMPVLPRLYKNVTSTETVDYGRVRIVDIKSDAHQINPASRILRFSAPLI